jgi:nucleotide-binding universal stress UspA family protein
MSPTRAIPRLFSSVLCAIDFSAHSRAALRYAAAVAARTGGTLSVLHVTDPLLAAAAAAAYDERALATQSARELARFVEQAVGKGTLAASAIRGTVVLGEPAREIQRAARRSGADLVVLGSEGLSGAPRLFFGSTTARVLAQTQVPVLAVPPGRVRSAALRGWPGQRILAAIDLGRTAGKDVAAAAAIARWCDTELSLVHVIQRTRTPAWLTFGGASHDRARVKEARARLARLAQQAGAVATTVHVLVGDPAEQVATLASDSSVGLAVFTLRGDDRLLGDRKGATTYQVVCQTNTPVLAVPEGWVPPRQAADA